MTDSVHIIGVQFSSFTRAAQFCCEEIGVNYTLGTQLEGEEYGLRTPALKTINPFGKVPVLIHEGRALYETQSICRYLDNTFNQSRLQPQDPWQRAQVDQWCAAITAYVDKNIVRNYLLEFLFPKGEGGSVRKDVVSAAMPEVANTVSILEQHLGDNEYLIANQFTLADVMLMPVVHYLSGGPNNQELVSVNSPLRAYVKRLLARPAAQKVFI
jgi:glutathione S-transferase